MTTQTAECGASVRRFPSRHKRFNPEIWPLLAIVAHAVFGITDRSKLFEPCPAAPFGLVRIRLDRHQTLTTIRA
jgi:hypothetical protein